MYSPDIVEAASQQATIRGIELEISRPRVPIAPFAFVLGAIPSPWSNSSLHEPAQDHVHAYTNQYLSRFMAMRSFVAYCRVSTDKQGLSRLGLEAQQEAVRRYVESVGGSLLAEHIEIESGRCATRPILAEAIASCRRKKAILLIAKLDRLSRSVAFTAALMESDVEFIACDMPSANRFMIHLMSAFAEYEREQISARTKAALTAARARGVVLGSYGRQLADRNIADAAAFAEQLRAPVQCLLNRGCARLQDVADGLNDAGIVTREGAKWSPNTVQRVLRRLDLRMARMTLAEAA